MALSVGVVLSDTLPSCVQKLMPLFQGNCISDYASVAAAAVELGWCMKDETKFSNIKFSAQDLICRCKDCHTIKGNGCLGGSVKTALNYIKDGKAVGGSYSEFGVQDLNIPAGGPTISNLDDEGIHKLKYVDCLKYWTPICDPTEPNSNCANTPYDPKAATSCPTACDRKTGKTLDKSKILGAVHEINEFKTATTNVASMKTSIDNSKPVVGTMEIFEDMDFYLGTPNLYIHKNGQSLGVVAVIIFAHGTDTTTGRPFWDVLVPWDKKYDATSKIASQRLRIVQGINHCNIENKAWEVRVSNA